MKISGCILSVCLLLLAEQAAAGGHIETEKLGSVTFECREDWKIYNANCYKPIEHPLSMEYAYLTCAAQGSHLYYPENEIEYLNFVATLTDKTIWFGMYKDDEDGKWKIRDGEVRLEDIPKWGNLQPNLATGNASSVNPIDEVMIYDGRKMLPFVCKHRACTKDHVPCDQASKCIPKDQVCNGKWECTDGTDENNCEKYGTQYTYLEDLESGSFSTGLLDEELPEKTWILEAAVGKRIRLYVPGMNLPPNCVFLEVWSGAPSFDYSHMLHRFTGNFNSMYLYSTNQYLLVRLYTTDVGTGVRTSYVLQWKTDIDQIPYGETEEAAIATWKSILLPFKDALVKPRDLMLRWLITAPEGQLISYYVQIAADEGYSADDVDFGLMVYGMETTPLEYRYYYTSTTSNIHVLSTMVPKNGAVSLRYKSGCGMYIPDTYGVIVSPHPVPNDLQCTWTLNAGKTMSREMVIKFFSLDLKEDTRTNPQNKSEDKFKIEAAGNSDSPITEVAMYNGDDLSTVISSPGGEFTIEFVSDSAIMSGGFNMGFGTGCEDLDLSAETVKSTNMTYFQENVELSCPTGYKFHMNKYLNDEKVTLRCDSIDGDIMWIIDGEDPGDIPECQVVYCGSPTKIENGGVKMATGLTYGKVAQYSCNGGFDMNGGENATCYEDGMWTGVPTCTSSSCPALSQSMIPHGFFEIIEGNAFSGSTADFDTVVQYSCDEGYELSGALRSHCASDGWTDTSNPPSCRRVYCEIPVIAHSNLPLAGTPSPPESGQQFSVACESGYVFESGETGTISLLCQNNRTLDRIPVCEDIDECETNTDSCSAATTMCINTEGSYMCDCKQGFERVDKFACTDIKECDDEDGGCSTRCVEEQGSYHCECDAGFQLYEGDGFNGFPLPQGETGMRRGDRYHINHTCVAVQCPALSPVENGMHLSNTVSFHYKETVRLQCKDGFKVQTTGPITTSVLSTCQSDGTWDNLYSCEARECSLPVAVPTNGDYDKEGVLFGETVTLTCNMTSTLQKQLRAVCIYENEDVHFAGDDITKCPEINCGDPLLVMPAGGLIASSTPTTAFLSSSSKFTFACGSGSELTGYSNDAEGNTTVRCKENGRWNFGTLSCTNDMCTDPGTPGNAEQIANSYEEGSILYYNCKDEEFTISNPINYTCISSSGNLVWSNSLRLENLPECKDTGKPKLSGSCGETFDIEPLEKASFTPVTATDRFALASFSMNDHVQARITRLITDKTLTYTAVDFAGNTESCTVTINIIDRSIRPPMNCPDFKTIQVSEREPDTYNPSDDITWTGTSFQVNPPSISVSVNKIGTSQSVTAKVTDDFNRESSCTFLVNFEADACFQEQLFADSNANRVCNEEGGNIVCESTCNTGYVFSDKTRAKNFTCSGTGLWDTSDDPHDRFCLLKVNPQFDVDVTVDHRYGFAVTSACTAEYIETLTNSKSIFEGNIRDLCDQQQWRVSLNADESKGTSFNQFQAKFTLTLVSSVSAAESQDCIDKINTETSSVFEVGSIMACTAAAGSATPLQVMSVSATNGQLSCPGTGHILDGDVCLPIGPAQFWNEETEEENDCPDGEFQDEFSKTACKSCLSGQYPNSDKTGCQNTCPRGFRSNSGFYPCTPCDVNTYWTAKDTCTQCAGDSSTVGKEGATDATQCKDRCPVGTYSKTGYDIDGCVSCPLNFYQDNRGQMSCKECNSNQKTLTAGSISFSNCTLITDLPECNRTFCNDHGDCTFAYHEKVCTCDANTGYHGDRCQNMYHICDGNPCKNDATCNRGAGYRDFTCTCRKDLDMCEMNEVADGQTGPQDPSLFVTTVTVSNENQCRMACLDNDKCKDASYLISTCVLYKQELTADQLVNGITGQKHLRKKCTVAFGGTLCELDTKNDCEKAGCNEVGRCKDKINDFQCICPSSGEYTGELCSDVKTPCNPNPCVRGSCEAFGSVRFECTCPAGYEGDTCEKNIDECAMHPNACPYDVECMDQVNSYYCPCSTGFSGRNCQNTPDFCNDHDCDGDNVCYSSLDRMEGVCVCDTSLFDSRYRCLMTIDENESAVDEQDNLVATPGYLPDIKDCEKRCQDNPDCAVATYSGPDEFNRYICALYDNNYSRKADSTSRAIKKNCDVRPDEAYACDRKSQPCDSVNCNNGTCENLANGLDSSCKCENGFIGYRCQQSIDDCIGNLCENGAECIDEHLTYTCKCQPGYDGNRCQNNIEDCPGTCNTTTGRCEDGVDGYKCICNSGYVGPNCDVDYNDCSGKPCEHGGECTDLVDDFECVCQDGWQGKKCEQEVNNCLRAQACKNDGQCISLETSSFCRCSGGATGEFCGNATLLCDTLNNVEVCINGGVCDDGEGTATCSCPVVYDTGRCYMRDGMVGKSGGNIQDLDIKPVSSPGVTDEFCKNQCLNNRICNSVSFVKGSSTNTCVFYTADEATLTDEEASVHFTRFCPVDYQGVSCELVRDWCSEAPCRNGGKCRQLEIGYRCECEPGYSGPACQIEADPCDSNPCRGQATCQSNPTEYVCLCDEGSIWTGSSCKTPNTDITILVDSSMGQAPPALRTPFRLNTNDANGFSVIMRVRIHYRDENNLLGSVFALLGTSDLEFPDDLMYDFSLTVSREGIFVRYGQGDYEGILFNADFGDRLFDGDWHYLGIAIKKDGSMSATIDALHKDPVSTGQSLNLDLNAFVTLGYGYIAEYQHVQVYDRFISREDFSQALVDIIPGNPLQIFGNYQYPPSARFSRQNLEYNIFQNPNLDIPQLKCDDVEDIYYVSDDRLTSISSINQLVEMYESVTTTSGANLQFAHTVESALPWGYFQFIIIGEDQITKNYGECRSKLYIRYNLMCPSLDELLCDSVESRPCSDVVGGNCDVRCDSGSQVLAAPTPYFITCGSLGVYDYRKPFEETYFPSCVAPAAVNYRLDLSMQFTLDIGCTFIVDDTISKLDEAIRDNFLTRIKPKWKNICIDDTCSNLVDVTYNCDKTDNTLKLVFVKFSLILTSTTLEAEAGGLVSIEDALKIMLLIEIDMDLDNISGAKLIRDTLLIVKSTVCLTGYRLDMNGDEPACVPCSEGYYLNEGECKPCDYGQYQEGEAKTECDMCEDGKTTYRRGVADSAECKDICEKGYFYDKDEDKCMPCKRHFYQNEEGKNFCIPCDKSYKTVTNASRSANDCQLDCAPGEERNKTSKECMLCERGYWRSLTMDDCKKCPANKTTFLGERAEIEGDCEMDICMLGEYYSTMEKKCKPCDIGYYQDKELMLKCEQCPGNKTTRDMGIDDPDKCEFYCPPGYERGDTGEVCLKCQRGHYKDNKEDSKFEQCQLCPDDTTDMMGAVSSAECNIPKCGKGKVVDGNDCKACPQDSYSDVDLPTTAAECMPCGDLKGTEDTGSTSDKCKSYCVPGKFLIGMDCESCPHGYYKDNSFDTRFGNCTKCPDEDGQEKTTDDVGSATQAACSVYKCGAGSISTNSGCKECGLNTYQPIQYPLSTDECLPCQPKEGLITNTKTTGTADPIDCLPICDSGKYFVGSTCIKCARGTSKENVGVARFGDCADCPEGSTTEDTGSVNSSLCNIPKCPAGKYLENKVCTECKMDTYSEVVNPNSAVECISCGTISGTVYGTEDTGTDNSSLCKPTCPGGQQFDTETQQCVACPIGAFKGDEKRFDACTLCSTQKPGYVTNDVGAKDVSQCDLRDCQVGEKIVGIQCVKCPNGTYQNEPRKDNCKECGENLGTDGEGKTSIDDCQTRCGPGLQGTETCTRCPLGQFKEEDGYANCQDCPIDKTSNELRTECSIFDCSIGKQYIDDGTSESCEECEVGFFKSQKGNTQKCMQCPEGFTTDGKGQGSCALLFCVPGKYLSGDSCEPCPVDTYKNSAGNQECSDCPEKRTTDTVTGAKSEDACDTVICDPGNFRQSGQKLTCTPCAVNKYQPSAGKTSCFDCSDGKITLSDGQSNEDACVPECKIGQEYKPDTKTCSPCKTGTIKPNIGNTDPCQDCPKDKTTAGEGQSECSENKCQPGTYYEAKDGTIECKDCPYGKYSDMEMQESCTDCPENGTTQAMGTKSSSLCIDNCDAGAGYRTDLGKCEVCPKGQFNAKKGVNQNTCKLCPRGKTNTQAGSETCVHNDDDPPGEKRINLRVIVTVRVALDNCNDMDAIQLLKDSFIDLARKLLQMKTDECYNNDRRFCRGTNCDNLGIGLSAPVCQQLTRRKRDITHSLDLELQFRNISDFVTDTCDGNVNIAAREIISRIFRLYSENLSDETLEIQFVSYSQVETEDLCSLGEELVDEKCTQCQAGNFGSSFGVCTVCPVNTFQAMTGKTICTDCPDQTFTENNGSVAQSLCIPICQAGNEFDNATKTCSQCDVGSYKVAPGNDQKCTKCVADKTTERKGSTSPTDCSKTVCQAGQFYVTDAVTGLVECRPCEIGTFNPNVMVEVCQSCGNGLTTQVTGRKLITDCIKICTAGSGYRTLDRDCFLCQAGQYNNGNNPHPTMCKFCPEGTTTLSAGQSSCTPVPIPIPVKRLKIKVVLRFEISLTSCADTGALDVALTSVSLRVRTVLIRERNSRYNLNRSFCDTSCTGIVVKFKNNNRAQSCSAKSSGRRKREGTHTLDVDVEFNNVSESTVDTETNNDLPTEEVVLQIFNNNKDEISPDAGIPFNEIVSSDTTPVCDPGQEPVNDECVDCNTGRYSSNGATCELCPIDTYQDVKGQSSCKSCPAKTFNDVSGGTGTAACKSYCANNANYCYNRGICSNTGRRTASCSCFDDYEGGRCESKKEPTSNMPAILGGAIGGGAALLIIILIAVGVCMRCSRDAVSKERKPDYRDPEYIQNDAYEGTYDNFGYHGGQVRPVAPYPSVGYPAIGYKPDQSFEEGSYGPAYKYRPSIEGDDIGRPNDETRYMWTA